VEEPGTALEPCSSEPSSTWFTHKPHRMIFRYGSISHPIPVLVLFLISVRVSLLLWRIGFRVGTNVKYGVKYQKFIWAPCAQLYCDLATSTLPLHLGSYTRALLVSQDRRHLFVTPPSWKDKLATKENKRR
jgi:hypothetical protein